MTNRDMQALLKAVSKMTYNSWRWELLEAMLEDPSTWDSTPLKLASLKGIVGTINAEISKAMVVP